MARAGTWLTQAADGASGGTYLYSTGSEADVLTLVFSGTTIEIVYLAGPHLGTLALEVDDTVLRTVITTADQTAYQQTATLNYLTDEPHTLRVYAQEGGVVAVDAFRALLAEDIGGIQSSIPLPPPSAYEIAYNCDGNDICLRNPLATESPVQITNLDQFIAPEWSPDGRWILYHRDVNGTLGLGLLEPNGTDRGIFTLTPPGIESRKSWSADGKKILYASEGTIYYIDLTQCPTIYQDNTNTTPADYCPSRYVSIPLASSGFSDPNWHPDGRHFVFRYRNPDANNGAGQDQIYSAWLIIPSSGTAKATDVTMVSNPDLLNIDSYEHPTWSPDGSRLVVAHTHNSNEVLRMLIGTPSEPLTDEMDNYPDWSPSGTQLVYVNRPTNSLYLVPASGGSPIWLGPGASPSWNRTVVCSVPPPDETVYYRAPIHYNLKEGELYYSRSGDYQYQVDKRFVDDLENPKTTEFYHVIGVTDSNGNPVPVDDITANDGIWIEANSWSSPTPPTHDEDSSINCPGLANLPIDHKYDIRGIHVQPPVPWDSYSFTEWPVAIADMCGSSNLEIHALGYSEAENTDYARDRHHGVDIFTSDSETSDVEIVSIGDGLVVGIAKGWDPQNPDDGHGKWGDYELTEGDGTGYSVIVRYGHLYVLYGHLLSLDDDIWVGAYVPAGQPIGILGVYNDKHLHIVVRVFDSEGYATVRAKNVGTGILDFGDVAYNVYDVVQFYAQNPPGYNSSQTLATDVATGNLTPPDNDPIIRSTTLSFSGCNIEYITLQPSGSPNNNGNGEDSVIEEIAGYRGFYIQGNNLPSPTDIP